MPEQRSRRLEKKVAINMGGGSSGPGWGNGKATATLFAREGARVAVVDKDLSAATETASIIQGEGGEALPLMADVTDAKQVDGVVQQTRYGVVIGRVRQ